jgi:hypothetical protein
LNHFPGQIGDIPSPPAMNGPNGFSGCVEKQDRLTVGLPYHERDSLQRRHQGVCRSCGALHVCIVWADQHTNMFAVNLGHLLEAWGAESFPNSLEVDGDVSLLVAHSGACIQTFIGRGAASAEPCVHGVPQPLYPRKRRKLQERDFNRRTQGVER